MFEVYLFMGDKIKRNKMFFFKKARRRYPAGTITGTQYTDDVAPHKPVIQKLCSIVCFGLTIYLMANQPSYVI